MRNLVVALVLAVSFPASATTPDEQLNSWQRFTFRSTAACLLACPYWLDGLNADVDTDGREDVRFDACGNPDGTDGSLSEAPGLPYEEGMVYDQMVVGPRPEGAVVLIAEIYPVLDWDLFICSEDGDDLGWCSGAIEECSTVWPPKCDSPLGPNNPVPFGCSERAVVPAAADRRFVLRAYNWSDPFPLEGRYCFSSSGSCS